MLVKARILAAREVICPGPSHIDEVMIEALLIERKEKNIVYEVLITVRAKDRRRIHTPTSVWTGVFEDEKEALRALEDKLYDLSRLNDLGFGCHESSGQGRITSVA